MWGVGKPAGQLDFIPDKDDRTARAKAARSLTAVSAGAPRRNDKDDRNLPEGKPGTVVEDKVELPWGSYLGKKREKERLRQKERDGRAGSQWPPNGGSGWMPFRRETPIGRTDVAFRLYGAGSGHGAAMSTTSRRMLSTSTTLQTPSTSQSWISVSDRYVGSVLTLILTAYATCLKVSVPLRL